MPRLLTINNRIANATNFIESLGRTSPSPENLYLFFGKSDEWSDENDPDTPTADTANELETRSNIIGIKKITTTNMAFVIPRYDWTTGTVYAEYDPNDANLNTKQFYVISSSNNVYKCIDNNSNGTSIVEPTGTSTSPVSTGDGYTWKFMYNLSTSMINDFLTNDWLPVPYKGQKTSFQTSVEDAASYTSGSPVGGHGSNAIFELGAKRVMISQTINKDESGTFPVNNDYRQYGLIINPLLTSTGNPATGNVYSVNDSNSDINQNSGYVLFVDNRKAISRSPDQAESFKIIMQF